MSSSSLASISASWSSSVTTGGGDGVGLLAFFFGGGFAGVVGGVGFVGVVGWGWLRGESDWGSGTRPSSHPGWAGAFRCDCCCGCCCGCCFSRAARRRCSFSFMSASCSRSCAFSFRNDVFSAFILSSGVVRRFTCGPPLGRSRSALLGVLDRERARHAGVALTISAHATRPLVRDALLLRLLPFAPRSAEQLVSPRLRLSRLRPRFSVAMPNGGKLRSSFLSGALLSFRSHCRRFTIYGILNLFVHPCIPVVWGPPHSLQCGLHSNSCSSPGSRLPHARHTRTCGCGHTSLLWPICPHVVHTSRCCLYRLHLSSTAPYLTVDGTLRP